MGKDFYEVLGLSRNATPAEIKKAYRKMSLKHHPDKGGEASKFAEVSNAFEVLSDPEKKKTYDLFGESGLNGSAGPPPGGDGGSGGGFPHGMNFSSSGGGMPGGQFHFGDPSDIFKAFFGTSDPFAAENGGAGGASGTGGMGGMGGMPFGMSGMGGGMPGMGGMQGMHMGGMPGMSRGAERPMRQAEPVVHPFNVTLEDIFTGTTKKMRISKTITHSNGRQEKVQTDKEIIVKKGWKEGTKITFPKEGDVRPGVIPADIVFEMKLKPHAVFKRDGDNLVYSCDVSVKEALCDGVKRNIPMLSGKSLPLSMQKMPGSGKGCLKGEGLPNQKTGKMGDLIVEFKVRYPDNLTQSEKATIRDVLSAAERR